MHLLHVVPVVLLVARRQVVWSAAVLAAAAADAVPGHELRTRRMPFPDAVRAQARDAQQALRLHPNAVAPCIEPAQQVHIPTLQHRHTAGCALTTLRIMSQGMQNQCSFSKRCSAATFSPHLSMPPDQPRPAPDAQACGGGGELRPRRDAEVHEKCRHDGSHVLGQQVRHHAHARLLAHPRAHQPVQTQQLKSTPLGICNQVRSHVYGHKSAFRAGASSSA
jgi:hypothetical protein